MARILLLVLFFSLLSCADKVSEKQRGPIEAVDIEVIYSDTVSIRTLEILEDNSLAFSGSDGNFGLYDPVSKSWATNILVADTILPSFRATAHTSTDFFMLSAGSPALLYKTGDRGQMNLVYAEDHPDAFYDSMRFWNDLEGIAMGDPTDGCLSVIITRDGGLTWKKLSCDQLPEAAAGEAAFAASNTNISTIGDKTWMISGGMRSRVFYSPDKGVTWSVYDTPLVQGSPTTGGYSLDFYNEDIGFIMGGDYTEPENNSANKALSLDGGKSWKLVAENKDPGYKSCVQFIPRGEGQELVAIGFTGISYSNDQGNSWEQLSEEPFYTIRFLNDTVAYAAGQNRIAQLRFKRAENEKP